MVIELYQLEFLSLSWEYFLIKFTFDNIGSVSAMKLEIILKE